MRRLTIGWLGPIVFVVLAATWPAAAFAAQAPAPQANSPVKPEALAGTYKGTATNPDGGTLQVNVTLKYENGAFSGTVEGTGVPPLSITGGTLTGDRLVLTVDMGGNAGTITSTVKDAGRVEGTYAIGDVSGTVALTRDAADAAKPAADNPATADAPASADPKPAANDPITGQWDGITGNNDMSVPFTMRLKLDGGKVTGDISSEQGGAPLTVGTWKDGALTLSFEMSGMGTITMTGAIQEGKLVGSLDVAGQMQMQWAAVRK